jgi:hypothetical protein
MGLITLPLCDLSLALFRGQQEESTKKEGWDFKPKWSCGKRLLTCQKTYFAMESLGSMSIHPQIKYIID